MQKEIFDRLAEKYLAGEVNEEEKQLMEELLRRMGDMDAGQFSELQAQEIVSSLYGRIRPQLKSPSTGSRFPRSLWFKMSAAAAALLLVLAGYYYWAPQKDVSPLAEKQNAGQYSLLPGTDAAILTLGDGSQVILDSAGRGAISRQGLADIINRRGRLAYNAAEGEGNEAVAFNTVTTPRGGQYQVTLSDGTNVWLNAMASIRFPAVFTGKERIVEATGEVYFEVAKDKERPFHVRINGLDVQALGTQFNINAYPDEPSANVTLLEGSVRVAKGDRRQLLKPGQQARVTENEDIIIKEDVNLDQATAWKNGQFYLTGSNIREIMRQISRWYNAEVVYEGDVSGIDFYGVVERTKNISELLGILEKTGIVHFRIEGKKIIVSK
ncbi:MAG: FecR domain-containing protein [Chitinophagaceae bacterium]|nr:FecR domain-containing protein [Chitinophagaceae bacterium]